MVRGYLHFYYRDGLSTVLDIDRNNQVITITDTANSTVREDHPYFVYNVLEELDTPGEYWLDRTDGKLLEPQHTDPVSVSKLIAARGVESISYDDWRRLDELEVERGESVGRPRVKFTSVQEMLANLGRT
jgi:hypothetical protein